MMTKLQLFEVTDKDPQRGSMIPKERLHEIAAEVAAPYIKAALEKKREAEELNEAERHAIDLMSDAEAPIGPDSMTKMLKEIMGRVKREQNMQRRPSTKPVADGD